MTPGAWATALSSEGSAARERSCCWRTPRGAGSDQLSCSCPQAAGEGLAVPVRLVLSNSWGAEGAAVLEEWLEAELRAVGVESVPRPAGSPPSLQRLPGVRLGALSLGPRPSSTLSQDGSCPSRAAAFPGGGGSDPRDAS